MHKILVLLSIVSAFADAQNNLEHFIRTAEKNSPLLKEYSNRLSSSALQRELIGSQQRLPQISLSAGYLFAPFFNNNGGVISTNPDRQAIGYDIGITNGGLYSAQINVEKKIFNGRLIDALSNTQSIQEASIRSAMALTRRDLVRQVTDLYLQTYQSQKLYELSKETSADIRQLLAILAQLVERGTSRQSEYLLLSIESESKTIAAADSYVQYRTDLNQLNTLCGIDDSALVRIDSAAITIAAGAPPFEFAQKFRLDSLAARVEQEVSEDKYRPQVSLFFNTGLNAVELENIQRKFGVSAGINFSIPLFDGNQRSITRQQTELSLQSIAGYTENFSVQLNNQRKNTLDRLEHMRNALNSLSIQMSSYDTLIQLSANELRRGQMSMIDYLTVLRNYVEMRKNKISAETGVQREINNYNYWN